MILLFPVQRGGGDTVGVPPGVDPNPEHLPVLLNGSSGKVLCKKIRGVRGPEHLKKSKGRLAQALLNPELANRQMADTANSAPPANPYGGGAVREHLQP